MGFSLSPPKMKKWALTRAETAGDYRVFRVDRHTLRDSSGGPRHDIHTFVCPDWCNVIAVTDDGFVVFVWQHRFGTDALSLEIPGGVVDEGESPIDAARRELLEETGYEAGALEPILSIEPNPALQNNRCHTFLAWGAKKIAEPSFDEAEELELALVHTRDLADLLDQGHVTHALVHSAIEIFLRKHAKR